ncbi:MAG: hypothetical protein IPN03_12165 [Holophagales bacterium]|nr:hypothetical protein [Holophagales bacterium]
MPRNFASIRAAIGAAGVLLAFPAASATGAAAACPPDRPSLSVPAVVNRFEGYTISWTNVLADRPTGPADIFVVERSEDPAFAKGVEGFKTRGISTAYGPPLGAARTLYHRVAVQSFCAGPTAVRVESTVLPVTISDYCAPPIEVEPPAVSPEAPPAYTTYVVSWDTLNASQPGPGGGAQGLRFRLRRSTSFGDVKETLIDTGTAAFADGPGEYLYQLRTENICGEVSAWSRPARVLVGTSKTSSLVLVSAPKPFIVPSGANAPPSTRLTVRNAGSEALDVTASSASGAVVAHPGSFRVESGDSASVSVTVVQDIDSSAPLHEELTLIAKGVVLRVPIDVGGAAEAAEAPAGWDDEGADVDALGNGLRRTLVNPGSRPASIVTSISAEWITIQAVDGKTWDRPLAPGERRPVWIGVDRGKRRAAIGTEVATVTVVTAGHPGSPKSLSVIDDGPLLSAGSGGPSSDGSDLPPLYLMKSRLLFPSLPNAVDVRGIGRYTSDVWLSNVDALSPIQVVLTLTPSGQGNTSLGVRQFVFTLGAGETRRFRNIVGTVFGYEGSCSLDISSPAATLSATAMVNNKPLVSLVAGKTAALGTAVEGTILSTGEFGFEMRPVAAGEGASAYDRSFIVSGLWHDATRRTNLILRETTGNATRVVIRLFDNVGTPIQKDGQAVSLDVTVPALGSIQINDADLFPAEPITAGSLWAQLEFQRGVIDPFGRERGAVVPFATVIDSGTQDASLRVGVSRAALVPAASSAAASVRSLSGPLPYAEEVEPVLFPVAHVTGAPLSSGNAPRWKTRVTLANVNDTESRNVRLRFIDKSGNLPQGASATATVFVPAQNAISINDVLENAFLIPAEANVWGTISVDALRQEGSAGWEYTWADVDVQTETYTRDTVNPSRGEFRTGMEGYSYRHGYSSFQSNLGTALIEGAETSPRYRTNLILQEVGGAPVTVAVGVYQPGALVPLSIQFVSLKAGDYISRELFRDLMKLDLEEVVDARVVVRQMDGDGVFMAFVSKINLVTGDPANVFLRPASAGTGR